MTGPPFRLRRRCALTIACAVCVSLGGIIADDSPPRTSLTERIVETSVVSDQISAWTKRGWRAMPRDEFESLKRAASPKPDGENDSVWVEKAEYSATFVNGELRDGTLTATVAGKDSRVPELLSLEPLNVALSDVIWSDGSEAVWGAAPDGRSLLWVESNRGQFSGRWKLNGRPFSRGFRFDVQCAPAAVSRIHLRLPDGWVLTSTVGDVSGPQSPGEQGLHDWLVELGSETSCRLSVVRIAEASTSRSLVFVNTDVSHAMRTDGLQVDARFDIEVLEAPTSRFVFSLPSEFRIISVTYGRDEPVSWTSGLVGGAQQLIVELPDALSGHGRPIRIAGNVPPSDDRWVLPTPKLLNSTLISGKEQLRIEPPLELQSFEKIEGYKHDTTLVNPSQGSSYTFIRNRDEAAMIVRTGRPRLDLDARVVNYFDATRQTWYLTSQVEWIARSGSTYSVACSLPPQWEPTQIIPRSPEDRSQISQWRPLRSADGTRFVLIEFKDALTPEHPKSVRIVCERAPAGSQQVAALPTLQPRDCVVVDSVVVVSHNSKVTPHLEATANVERIDEAALPEFVANSPLWKEVSATNANRLLLLVKGSVSGQSTLIMENSEPSFEADAQTTLDLHADDFVETFVATITPKSEPVKRVLVYLSQTGMQPSWQAFTEPEAQVSATRVSVAQHSTWNLPSSGELWELQLSRSQDKPFRVVGSRKSLIATTPSVTLMFLPSAETFRGNVELRASNDLNVDVTAANLRSAEPKLDPGSDATSRWISRTWGYESPTASLEIGLPGAKSTADPNVWGEVELQTILADAGHDSDRHRAVFRITTGSSPSPLNFRMPNEARLVSVQINGRVVTPSRQGPEFTLLTTGNESNVVEILYETRKSTGLLFDRHSAPIPLSSCKVLYCAWRLAIPPETHLTGTSETILIDRDTDNVSWSQRFFGPLGRRRQENLFNPFSAVSWQSLVAWFVPNLDELPDALSQDVPANYVVARGRAPDTMQSVSFKTWSGFRSSCLGWIVLATSAVITLVLRRTGIDGRTRGWLVWVSMLVLVAAVAPAPFTAMTGGAVTGTLIALLLPRTTFIQRPIFVPRKNVISLGSTATFGHASRTARLLIFAAGLTTVGSALSWGLRVDGQEQSVADSDEFRVLVSGNGHSSTKDGESIVYLSTRLIDGLRAASNQSHHQPAYLLSTAEYRGKVEDLSYVTLEATYRIVVLSSSPVTRVFLPLSNANLGGENACLVNGKPQPIYLAKQGDGYEVELFHSDQRPVVARKPATTNSDTNRGTLADENDSVADAFATPEQFDVQLKLRPAATRISSGAQFNSRIPTATGARVNLEFDKLYASVVVAGDEGEVASDQKETKVQSQLGKSSQLSVSWSTSARQIISPVTMEAGVSCLVEVHPAWLGYRYHVDYRVLNGQVDFIHWQIPTRAVVRSVDSNSLGLNHFHERSSGDSKLLIDLAEPQRGAFSIDAYLIVPIESTGSEFQVPAPEIIGKSDSVKILMNQIGVTVPPDFVLSAKTVESNDIARVSGESFASSAHFDAFNSRTPLYAYRLQAASVLTFDLAPEPTLRKVRQAQSGRISGRDIEWEFSADVEVTGRPAFEHTLIVDPSLRIESISVQEDKAERLLRPSVSGDRIHLFLSDETSGSQHIQLRCRASLQVPATTCNLPLIRVEDAKIVDATLTLLRQTDVSVEMIESASLESVLNADANRPTVAGEVLVGKYRCNLEGPSPQMKLVRKGDHVRVDTATLVKRHPGGGAELSFAMAFRRSAAVVPKLRLSIPPDLAAVYRLSYTNAESKPEKHPDGSVELVFTPGPDSTQDVVAVVTADVTPPTGPWQIPRVLPLDADKGANYLLTSPPDDYAPEQNSASRIVPETLPSWIREATSFDGKTSTWNVFSGDGSQWTLKKGPPTNNAREIRVPLVSTECWWERNGELAGRTEIFAIAEGSHDLALRIPRDARIGTLVVDGQMAVAKSADSSQLILNLGTSSKTHVVVLTWSLLSGSNLPDFGEVQAMIPRLVTIKPERTLCAIAPPEGRTLITKSGSKHLESLVAWVSRLEGLVAVMWESGNGDPLQSALWQLVIDTRNTCIEDFKLLGRPVDRRSSSAELHERFQRVQEVINRLQKSFGPTAEKSSPDRSRDSATVLGVPKPMIPWNPNLMLSDATDAAENDSMSFLIFRDQWAAYALCAVGLLIVPMCLLKFTRAGYAERLYHRSAVLWGICGVFWWTCLTLGAIGMFLFCIATFFLIGGRSPSVAA